MLEPFLKFYARHFPMRRGKYRIIERFGARSDAGGGFVRHARLAYGGFSMRCDLRKQLQRQFYYFGTYFLEERVLNQWSKYASTSQLILDVGANAGIYSLAAAAANHTSSVHSFEPTPAIAAHLADTIQFNGLNSRIRVHQCAVAAESGKAHLNFFLGEHADNEGMNFVSEQRRNADSLEVTTVSLDDFCAEHGYGKIDLLKIDVQGNEPQVLAGARQLIARRAVSTLFFELNWASEGQVDCPAEKSVSILKSAGYKFADPNGSMRFQNAGPWLRGLSDVVASAQ